MTPNNFNGFLMIETAQTSSRAGQGEPEQAGRELSYADMARLRVDDKGRLLWDGRAVEVSKSFSLTRLQVAYAVMSLVVAIVGVMAAAFSAWADWETVKIERAKLVEVPPPHAVNSTSR